MSEHVLKTLELVSEQVERLDTELAEKKRMANSLCALAGRPPMYEVTESARGARVRGDEYYGKKLATAIRMALEKRRHLGAASVQELFDALKAGGYHFQAKNDDYAKRGLYQALTKNTQTFHRLPNDKYGLLSWYESIPFARGKAEVEDASDESTVTQPDEATETVAVVAGDDAGEQAEEPEAKSTATVRKSKPR